jgi:hypothetical protein
LPAHHRATRLPPSRTDSSGVPEIAYASSANARICMQR